MRLAALLAAVPFKASRLLLPAIAALAIFTPFQSPTTAPAAKPAPATVVPATPGGAPDGAADGVASYYHPEVRLRKLHLVRPDLIPYPLAYDVYC